MEMIETRTGSCLCGGVAFELSGALRDIIACHCAQCRKTSGHHVAATRVPQSALHLTRQDTLRWYRSSPEAERGFCDQCGGNLFWRRDGSDAVSVFAGVLDDTTDLHIAKHIFVADKGDYYDIPEGAASFDAAD